MTLSPVAKKLLDHFGAYVYDYTAKAVVEAVTKPAVLSVEGNRLWLDSPYSPGALMDIKAISGRKFDADSKRWSFPADQFQAVYTVTMKHFPNTKMQLLKLASQLAPAIQAKSAAKASGVKSVTFEKYGKGWLIRSPYNPKFVDGMKNIPGRKWVGPEKAWSFPADMLDPVVKLAQDCYGADEVAEPPA